MFLRRRPAPPSPIMDKRRHAWLLLAALVTVLPHGPYAPTWVVGTCSVLFLWRAWLWAGERTLPPNWLLSILVLCGSITVFAYFQTLSGRDPGMALLLLLLTLKMLETRSRRDGLTLLFLACFLQLGLFFYSQTLVTALVMLLSLTVIVAALMALHCEARPAPFLLKRAALMLGQALPFALALFLLFPRIAGPLWGMPIDAYSGGSGLSDSMKPGSISNLIQSDAMAFRVRFDGALPAQSQLYWRGPVLSILDGNTWRAGASPVHSRLPYALPREGEASQRPVGYTVTLEPHNHNWLFALELPIRLPSDAVISDNFRLLAKTPVKERLRYSLASIPQLSAGLAESREILDDNLLLPGQRNPRTRQLASQWRQQAKDEADLLRIAIAIFRNNQFTYTLQPPLLGDNPVDEFLFDSRRGFCEHFAGSFVFALRAAGIPARVVTGYQGGEQNPVDGYLMVRQSDAHAWAEAWLPGLGWRRLDPTALAAPARIETSLAAAVPSGDPMPFMSRTNLEWLRDVRFRWQALANGWNQWVLGYNPERQRQLLSRLGMAQPDLMSMVSSLAGICGLLALALTIWATRRHRSTDPLHRAWSRLSRKLGRIGLARQATEGPLDYAQRVAQARPALAQDMERITELYIQLRYGRRAQPSQLRQLKNAIARLRP